MAQEVLDLPGQITSITELQPLILGGGSSGGTLTTTLRCTRARAGHESSSG